jgi:hypothetical protein
LLRQVKVAKIEVRMRLPTMCPKCQRDRQPGEDACARCGLLVARWDGFAASELTHPALDVPWAELAAAWDDDTAHARFLELAATVDALDVAAACYRRVRRDRPDDARAERGLERAVTLAQRLYVMRAESERPPRAPVILKMLGTMCAGLILLAALWTLAHVMWSR